MATRTGLVCLAVCLAAVAGCDEKIEPPPETEGAAAEPAPLVSAPTGAAERTEGLLKAIRAGDPVAVKQAIRNGADPKAPGAYQRTPLHVAEKAGHKTIVEMLRKRVAKTK